MKILHTIPGLSISSGGPSACTYHLLKGMRKQNIDVNILTLLPKNSNNKIIGNDNFIKAVQNDTCTPMVYSRNFRNYLRQYNQYDLYHANSIWTYPTHITLHHALKQDKPCIIAPHGMLYPEALRVSKWKKKITLSLFQRNDLKMANCLQATCMHELQHIRDFGLTNPVAVIQNCLNMDDLETIRNTANTTKLFGFIGRLHRIKNLESLFNSWVKLGDLTNDAKLLIIGSGDVAYETELHQCIDKQNIRNISFTGFLKGESLIEIFHTLDYLILPSHSENFGMVVPEALIKGIPVIASKGTPWEELNAYHCGWWVNNDVDTLAATIETAINTIESKRKEMGENGRRLVMGNYSVEVAAEKMIRLYDWILNGGEKPEFVYL